MSAQNVKYQIGQTRKDLFEIGFFMLGGIHNPILSYIVKKVWRGFPVKDYIEERAMAVACYIIEHNATVRQAAKQFGISKSTVHKDITERLEQINPGMAREARKVLDVNKSERHIRGGLATREKYLHHL